MAACTITLPKAAVKAAAPASFRRYRRSSVCRAPRKRTFIANMQKFIIEAELPSGLAGESYFGSCTALVSRSACGRLFPGLPQAAALSPMLVLAYGQGGNDGNGNGRGGNSYENMGDGDGDSDASEQLSVLPLAVAVALCAALYPTLEAMAAQNPMAASAPMAAPKVQLAAAPAPAVVAKEAKELGFEKVLGAALLGEASEAASEEALQMA